MGRNGPRGEGSEVHAVQIGCIPQQVLLENIRNVLQCTVYGMYEA